MHLRCNSETIAARAALLLLNAPLNLGNRSEMLPSISRVHSCVSAAVNPKPLRSLVALQPEPSVPRVRPSARGHSHLLELLSSSPRFLQDGKRGTGGQVRTPLLAEVRRRLFMTRTAAPPKHQLRRVRGRTH